MLIDALLLTMVAVLTLAVMYLLYKLGYKDGLDDWAAWYDQETAKTEIGDNALSRMEAEDRAAFDALIAQANRRG